MSEKNALVPHAPCARPSSPSRRRLLRLALVWPAATLPLFWKFPAAEAANSSAEWSADPEAARAAKLLKAIGSAYWIPEGAGPRIVYIFFDPNCPFSHKLYLSTRAEVGKGGVVRDPSLHQRVCDEVREWLEGEGWAVQGIVQSPITGPEGNVEFLISAERS